MCSCYIIINWYFDININWHTLLIFQQSIPICREFSEKFSRCGISQIAKSYGVRDSWIKNLDNFSRIPVGKFPMPNSTGRIFLSYLFEIRLVSCWASLPLTFRYLIWFDAHHLVLVVASFILTVSWTHATYKTSVLPLN